MTSDLLGHVTPLRVHYFWPLTVRTKHVSDMAAVVNRMQSLGLRLDFDTLAFYVLPNLIAQDKPIHLLQHLQHNCKLSVSTLLGPLLHALLSAKLLTEAVVLCKSCGQI